MRGTSAVTQKPSRTECGRMNLRLRKGTVQVRGRTEDRSHHWHVLRCQRFPIHPLPARPSRPRGLPALRQARRTGHPHPLPARVSFGWFRQRESNPRGSTGESLGVFAPSSGGMARGGCGTADNGGAGPRLPPRGARRGSPSSCCLFPSPPDAEGCPLCARCTFPFSLLSF